MPLYEYQCETCEHRFEKIQKFTDPPPDKCPKCGGAVRKLFSSPAIQFKGSGFYITDYAKKSADGADSGSSEKKEKGGTESVKSDSGSTKTDSGSTKTGSGSAKSEPGSAKTESGSGKKPDAGGSSSGGSPPASSTKE
jgi:putative FmdB family regulatory protein